MSTYSERDLVRVLPVHPVGDPDGVGGFTTSHVKTLYDIAPTYIYVGTAPLGSATSDAVWTIRKITFTSGNPSSSTWTAVGQAVWDNRTTETYT